MVGKEGGVPVLSKEVGLVDEPMDLEEVSLSVVLGVLSILCVCVTGYRRSPTMSMVALPTPMNKR
jgi:hypothetical protein